MQFGITEEETGWWRSERWLTVGADALETLTDQDLMELRFVAGLARSTYLSASQVNDLLELLEKPYSYDPATTAFLFAEGRWIQVPPNPNPEDILESHFEEVVAAYADRQEYATLRGWRDRIQAALDAALDEAAG